MANFLGLKLAHTSYVSHFKEKAASAKVQVAKLWRVSQLDAATKRWLYLTLVQPILTYPVVPLHDRSRTSLLRLQRVQNAATRFICNSYYPEMETSQELHRRSNLLPLNQVLHKRACNLWMTIRGRGYEMLQHFNEQGGNDNAHQNFPQSMHGEGSRTRTGPHLQITFASYIVPFLSF